MGSADGLGARFGQAEILDLALPDQIAHRAGHVLDGHGRIDPVLVVHVDHVGPEPLQRGLGRRLDVLGPAAHRRRDARVGLDVKAELGCDHHLIADRRQRLAHQLLIDERTIDLGGVEQGDPALHGGSHQGDHLAPVLGRAIGIAHAHAAKPYSRDLKPLSSKCARLHLLLLRRSGPKPFYL